MSRSRSSSPALVAGLSVACAVAVAAAALVQAQRAPARRARRAPAAGAAPGAAAPAPATPAPACGAMAAAVLVAGCDGAPRWTCDTGASLPAGSTWCACDGRTLESWSMAPPTGVRYRFAGPCETTARFELTPERREDASRTGRVVVFLAVANGTMEVARPVGPCRDLRPRTGELARIACGSGAASSTLVARRQVDAVVVDDGGAARADPPHLEVPGAQVVRGARARRF